MCTGDAHARAFPELMEIRLAGGVTPTRARTLMDDVSHSTREADHGALLQFREALRIAMFTRMADHRLDVLVHATDDTPPAPIPADLHTNARVPDGHGSGDDRGALRQRVSR